MENYILKLATVTKREPFNKNILVVIYQSEKLHLFKVVKLWHLFSRNANI